MTNSVFLRGVLKRLSLKDFEHRPNNTRIKHRQVTEFGEVVSSENKYLISNGNSLVASKVRNATNW